MKQRNDNITVLSPAHAAQIAGWTYKNEYAVYSFTQTGDTLDELMNGEYYARLEQGELIGYFCFGQSARIPTVEKDAYTDEALDMGLGMRPDLCGQGLGYAFVKSGLGFAQSRFACKQLRLTVAAFNLRAIRVYEKLGFRRTAEISHRLSHKPFLVMIRACEQDVDG